MRLVAPLPRLGVPLSWHPPQELPEVPSSSYRDPRWIALLCGLAFTVASSASVASPDVESLLETATTRDELSRRIGAQPYRCILGPGGTELCAWHTGDRSKVWPELARALGTKYAVNVICRLLLDGSPRGRGSCVVRPRKAQASLADGSTSPGTEPAALVRSRTLTEISFLIGDVPWDCTIMAGGRRSCVWKATSATYGYPLVRSMLRTRRKVRLACVIPRDGSPREPNSCAAEIGD